MVDTRRHVPAARYGSFPGRAANRKAPLMHRGAKSRGTFRDMYAVDHAEPQREGRFRWLMSTCLAAAVGTIAIVVVIFGSADQQDTGREGLMPALQRLRESTAAPPLEAMLRRDDGLRWAVPKVDRLRVVTGALSTRYIIHETLRQKRGGREYIYAKPYVRIVARLAPVPTNYADVIPPFNPFKLYDNNKPIGSDEDGEQQASGRSDVSVRVVELLGGILPGEDGQEIDADEARELVSKTEGSDVLKEVASSAPLPGTDPASLPLGAEQPADQEARPPNTTILSKSSSDGDDLPSDIDALKTTVKTVRDRQKLSQLLAEAGSETWQIREMIDAMKSVLPESAVLPGQEVHIALQPSITRQNRMEPVRFTVYDEGHAHKVTVMRTNAGEFVASATPMDNDTLTRLAQAADGNQTQASSLYASLYHAALMQSVPPETIAQILKTHAYETDFRRRLRSGDTCEMFFDLKDEGGTEGPPGELLYTAITTGGETTRYYRYRTPDGKIDYYDAAGNNAKKFLMRKPVRSDDSRLTSGFGLRFHPLLNEKRMHTGVDWASPPGTPVLASGNGTIEEAGRKGQYGNYIRIRHANGYQTAYGHMARLAQGATPGVKVRQGQVIGFVGSTGLSSGPHLHFEVLVNNQFVDPMSIQVPREHQLVDRELGEFQKERSRIDDLMRRAPVLTASK